ncbi:hypothetical protein K3495_g8353 [Podosphaera aphanis]|nr:hypothetical protein K3495_g8353 [Podosphaera aphanis]
MSISTKGELREELLEEEVQVEDSQEEEVPQQELQQGDIPPLNGKDIVGPSIANPNVKSLNKRVNDLGKVLATRFQATENSMDRLFDKIISLDNKLDYKLKSNAKSFNDRTATIEANIRVINSKLDQSFSDLERRLDSFDTQLGDRMDNLIGKLNILDLDKKPRIRSEISNLKIVTKESKNDIFAAPLKTSADNSSTAKSFEAPATESKSHINENVTRNPNGRLELHKPRNNPSSKLTPAEKFVKEAWPQAIFPEDIGFEGETSAKNRVSFKPEWRLVTADHSVFNKLKHIQASFQMALVPYRLWSQRLALEMDGDFKGVGIWALKGPLSWITLLEAIFTIMQDHNVLQSPMTKFSRITPTQGELITDFAWRLRDAFYDLPESLKENTTVRNILTDIGIHHLPRVWSLLEPSLAGTDNFKIVEKVVHLASRVSIHHLPRVWSLLEPSLAGTDNFKIVEKVVHLASRVSNWSTEERIFKMSPDTSHVGIMDSILTPDQSRPMAVADPRMHSQDIYATKDPETGSVSDDMVFAIKPENSRCYKCGKMGHWAKQCNSSSTLKPQTQFNPKWKNTKLEALAERFSGSLRNKYNNFKNKPNRRFESKSANSGNRAYIVDQGNLEPVQPSQDDLINDYDDSDELIRFFEHLESQQYE